jgi:hypothetical protein
MGDFTKDEWRTPIFSITSDGRLGAGVKPLDEDDPQYEWACFRTVPDWMIKQAFIAILKKELDQ